LAKVAEIKKKGPESAEVKARPSEAHVSPMAFLPKPGKVFPKKSAFRFLFLRRREELNSHLKQQAATGITAMGRSTMSARTATTGLPRFLVPTPAT